MSSYLSVANSGLLFICVGVGILFVLSFAFLHFRKCWRRAEEVGLDMSKMKNVMKASAIFSIVPSVAIIIGMFSLMAMLGVPWPWFRLSVIGSVAYEIMAADSALKVMGLELSSADAKSFVTIMYVMSICIMSAIIFTPLISKKIQEGARNMKVKDERWGALGNSTFMMSIVVVIMTPMILGGGVGTLTWLTSFVTTLVLGLSAKRFNISWLGNFVLAISLLVAMSSSVFWSGILG